MMKKCSSTDTVRMLFFADVHMGASNTPDAPKIEAIRNALSPTHGPAFDIIIVAGDFTDGEIKYNEVKSYYSNLAIRLLIDYCEKHGTILRVVEGTKSHDRGQPINFEWMIELVNSDIDFKYFKELSIEYIEKLNMNFLYLPDEWNPDASVTFTQMKELIKSRGLSQVDIGVIHGACTYQMQGVESSTFHDAEKLSSLVKYRVFAGHIHTHSRYLKYVSISSLDRSGHNEEEAKGCVIYEAGPGDRDKLTFLENPYAKKFVTLNVTGKDINEVIELIKTKALPPESAIRLEFFEEMPIKEMKRELSVQFPQYIFTHINRLKTVRAEVSSQSLFFKQFPRVPITRENVNEILSLRLSNKQVDAEKISLVNSLIAECFEDY